MMKSFTFILLLTVVGLCLAGCATPAHRIKKNPELFASFPPDVQEKVQNGEIDIGFNKDMVQMALGTPDRMYSRHTEAGDTEVWSYVDFYTTTDRQRVDADVRVRDANGIYQPVHDMIWVNVDQRHEYEKLRVEFEDGKVKAIETLDR